jgi:hypothetical protein
MNKAVKRLNTGSKGLTYLSNIQGFEPYPRFG